MIRRVRLLAGAVASLAALSPAFAQTPAISVTITPSSAIEGSKFQVSFSRTGDSTLRSTVAWRISGAVDGADFGVAALPGGVITFTPGQVKKGFALFSANDTMVEPDEAFDLVLSSPTNATIATPSASATIRNDDVAPSKSPLTLFNPSHSAYWAREDAFINHILVAGKDHDLWVAQGLFDPATARFVKMPPSGPIKIGPVRGGGVPGAGDFYKGKWILDWQGDGDLTITGGAGTMTRVSTNRIEEDYDPALHGSGAPNVRITRIGAAGVSNIRFYRATHEALINSGKIFDPRWLADVARFDVFRPMDWTGVNSDQEIAAADRPLANRPFYMDGRVPDWVLVRAAVESGTQLWLNAPGLLGCPPSVAAALRDTTLPQSTRIAAARAAFDQVMASPEPLNWARKIVAELNAQSYPTSLPIFIELDNEVWNTTFHATTNFYTGLGQEVAARHSGVPANVRAGYGFRSAQFAQLFAQALGESGRANQPWTMVLAAQTVDPTRTVDALAAVPAFGGSQPMSRYGVSTTNYVSGGFTWHRENMLFGATYDQATWRQLWLADLAADPAALYQKITNYMLAPTSMRANVAYYASFARAQKAAAEAAGARWIGNFEGDSTDKLDVVLAANPAAVALFRQWHESADYGRVITAIADDVRATDPKAIMATYVFCAARRTPQTPWVECTPWDQSGGDNAAWSALLKP
jgi:hypothetical protein